MADMGQGAVLRPAGDTDRPVLERFMAGLQEHERAMEANRTPGAEMAAAHVAVLLDRVAAHPAAGCLIAEVAGVPVGFLLWTIEVDEGFHLPLAARVAGCLSDLWVEPEARGRGLGRRLIAAAEAHLERHGVRHVTITAVARNAGAIALYERLGYRPCEVVLARSLGS
jgi:ribosomal protein S18 acetylase RimI-like enzyme